jgi:O-antigen/teichoic acid export membrane protein
MKAKLDLVEVPAFLALGVLLIPPFGIAGAAGAKLLVTMLDVAALFVFAGRLRGRPLIRLPAIRRQPLAAAASALLLLGLAMAATGPLAARTVMAVIAVGAPAIAVWRRVLDASDRAAVRAVFTRVSQVKEATP